MFFRIEKLLYLQMWFLAKKYRDDIFRQNYQFIIIKMLFNFLIILSEQQVPNKNAYLLLL
jgi:hypothetical protein